MFLTNSRVHRELPDLDPKFLNTISRQIEDYYEIIVATLEMPPVMQTSLLSAPPYVLLDIHIDTGNIWVIDRNARSIDGPVGLHLMTAYFRDWEQNDLLQDACAQLVFDNLKRASQQVELTRNALLQAQKGSTKNG